MSRSPSDNARDGQPSRQDVSSYIADLCSGLKAMAGKADLDFLAYLLSVAELEARTAEDRFKASKGLSEVRPIH